MASTIIKAVSTAIGRGVDGTCISQRLMTDNNSIDCAIRLAKPGRTAIISSILSCFISFILVLASHWGFLVLLAGLYLFWVASCRFNRLKAIKKKHGFTKDPKTYQGMTVDVAQEIERNLAEWEMPWLFDE
ncbi:hypothetical protein GP486_002305 [Trichoglossum hirsutum]|uniref:Uncharacterized protein n=1 Tax=Trichoglossum hirsutum TaxID=265104 RepID=A0A9P8RS89_9PEZI|nr:hypothetical protein GP486_002305 [Trichoglossum hirsutum]